MQADMCGASLSGVMSKKNVTFAEHLHAGECSLKCSLNVCSYGKTVFVIDYISI